MKLALLLVVLLALSCGNRKDNPVLIASISKQEMVSADLFSGAMTDYESLSGRYSVLSKPHARIVADEFDFPIKRSRFYVVMVGVMLDRLSATGEVCARKAEGKRYYVYEVYERTTIQETPPLDFWPVEYCGTN